MATYCTVEDVKTALDSKATARDDARVKRAIQAASADVDSVAQRGPDAFRPVLETRYFDWPPAQTTVAYRLWLDANPLISVTTLTAGGVTIPATDYYLEPSTYGPPYSRIDIDQASSSAWEPGASGQQAVAVFGLWAACEDTRETVGTLGATINSSTTAIQLSSGALVGVGDQLICGTERLDVTARSWIDTAVNTNDAMTASAAGVTLPLAVPATVTAGEVVLVDSERMLVVDVGTVATVIRAWDGSTLAAHSSAADVYANRGLTVTRAAAGSTAAAHTSGDTVTRHVVPPAVHALTVASAMAQVLQEQAGYRAVATTGSASRPAETPAGADLAALRERVAALHGRRARTRVV
jgi:hypothetical protein